MPKTTTPRKSASRGAHKRRTRTPVVTPPESKKRQIASPVYRTLHLSKRLRHKRPRVTGSFRLFKRSIATLLKRKRLFLTITLVYLVLTIVLVKGLGVGSNIGELKTTLTDLFGGSLSKLTTGVALFGVLLGNINTTNGGTQAAAYQSVLLVTVSLAVIWALRQTLGAESKQKLTARDAFYKGEYPLVPFLLVLIVIGLQLLPVVVASFLYSTVLVGGLAVTVIEKAVWLLIICLLILLSLYMITSSIFALYIVTLPEVRPLQALRSARDLVCYRRWTVMRKVLFLPVALLLLAAIITVPIILWSPVTAEWVFFILSMLGLAIVHSYLYTLYRELL